LVQTDEERKAKMKEWRERNSEKIIEYRNRPDVKKRSAARTKSSEYKERDKIRKSTKKYKEKAKMRRSTPEYKAKMKERNQRPDVKAKHKEYRQSERGKKVREKYNSSEKGMISLRLGRKKYAQSERGKTLAKKRAQIPEYKAKMKERRSRPEEKQKMKEYSQRPERILKRKEYLKSEIGRARTKKYRESEKGGRARRIKTLEHYSKLHSNSNVPCCRCCGETNYEFLAIDHILGKKQMDSIPELIAIGYSSKISTARLPYWITESNFPEGFQILCHNCNFAKGHSKDGKCPHQRTRMEETFAMMDEQSSFEV
jgi:hypothetical protein